MPDDTVHIQGLINGKPQRFILDSGSSTVQLYSKERDGWLSLKALPGESIEVVPTIQVGDLTVASVPVLNTTKLTHEPLLGDPFFRDVVLTIDYRGGIAEFRDAGYATTIKATDAIALPNCPSYSRWMPLTTLNVGGSEANCIIDTGANTSCVGVNRACFKSYIGEKLKFGGNGAMGRMTLYATKRPVVVLAGARAIGRIRVGTELPPEVDALIGNDILKNFRVTIDYPDGITYLEPYGKVDVAKGR